MEASKFLANAYIKWVSGNLVRIKLVNYIASYVNACSFKKYCGRAVLMESYDVRVKRSAYLRKLQHCINNGRTLIFTDESYIHSSHTHTMEWTDGTPLSIKKPISKGKRLIMLHAGGKEGFVPNVLLLFASATDDRIYFYINI